MTTSQIVEEILRDSVQARNSDVELQLLFFERVGVNLTPLQESAIRDCPSLETLTRVRRKIQEDVPEKGIVGRYKASETVRKERRHKSLRMQQMTPKLKPEGIAKVMEQPPVVEQGGLFG